MISRQMIKQSAKEQLGGKIFGNLWLNALLVFFIFGVLANVAASMSLGIVAVIITGPLTFGVSAVLLDVVRGSGYIDLGKMFSGFTEDFGRNFLIGFLSTLFVILWSILFIIPGIVKYYAYSMAYFVAKDHPEYDWKQCIDESQRLTRGHKGELFVLDLSFIGWYIVGAICLGVGTLWVVPYHQVARANYYEALIYLSRNPGLD